MLGIFHHCFSPLGTFYLGNAGAGAAFIDSFCRQNWMSFLKASMEKTCEVWVVVERIGCKQTWISLDIYYILHNIEHYPSMYHIFNTIKANI